MMDYNNHNNWNNYSPYTRTPVPQYDPEPPKAPETEKPKRKRVVPYVAGLLAVSLISGAAGGGVSYMLTNGAGGTVMTAVQKQGTESVVQSADASGNGAVSNATGSTSDIAAIASKASASVVEISVEVVSTHPFMGEYSTQGSGSGVILSEDGYIVTNNHVTEGANTITVRTNDGEEYAAMLIGDDQETDLAVLKIDAQGLQPATFADSDAVSVGELAVVIGNPLGTLGGTVTDGIISATDREITIDGTTMNLMQTSAAVNPGNSGGGLFNADGNLIGVVNAKSSGTNVEGLGFAIPSNTVRRVVDDIIESGYVTGRVELGISILDVFDVQTARMYRLNEYGVYVLAVSRDNGLRPGDRIISINGVEVESSNDVSSIIKESSVGDELTVQVVREGSEITVSVLVSEQVPESVRDAVQSAVL